MIRGILFAVVIFAIMFGLFRLLPDVFKTYGAKRIAVWLLKLIVLATLTVIVVSCVVILF